MSYYFQNARVLDPSFNGMILENATVVTKDDEIVFVGDEQNAPDVTTDAEVIDLRGRIILPSFVNAHAHSPMVLFRGAADDLPLHKWLNDRIYPMEAQLDDEAVYWGSMLAIAEMIRSGTSTFNDMYFMTEQTVRAVEQTHIRAALTKCVVCPTENKDEINRKIADMVSFYEQYHGAACGRIQVTLAPHAEYTCSAPMLEEVGRQAKNLNARIHIHVSETIEEHEACKKRHGKTPIRLLHDLGVLDVPVLAAHCVYVEKEDMEIMADKGVTVLHCPGSNLKLGSGVADIEALIEHGVNIALATDGAASNNNLDMFEEMQLSALIHKGVKRNASLVKANEAIRMATYNGAKALGLESGKIASGYKADLMIVSISKPHMMPLNNALNNVVYSANGEDVWMTMVDGKVLYRAGNFKTLDISRVMMESARSAAPIVAR